MIGEEFGIDQSMMAEGERLLQRDHDFGKQGVDRDDVARAAVLVEVGDLQRFERSIVREIGKDASQIVGVDQAVGAISRVADNARCGVEEGGNVKVSMIGLRVAIVDERKVGEVGC